MTTTCCENVTRLVRWNIVFMKPGRERAYPEHEELVSSCMSEAEFRNWKVAEFVREHKLPASDGCYLRVYTEVLRCYEKQAWDFEETQIAVLEQIRNAIRGEHHRHRVRLPKTLRLAGALNPQTSEFGDEFVNMPAFLGAHPQPGHTFLTGWVELTFSEPQGDTADFTLNWFGVGTPVQITFGGGQQFDFIRTKTFPLPFLPDLTPVSTVGRLSLVTGQVEPESVKIFATFQGTTIGRTDRVNRIPYAFPFIFPPLPTPPGFQFPPGYQPPQPMPPVFGNVEFAYDLDGNITGFELHSETFAPVGLFPYLQGFFPPFSFGPHNQFHFALPDRCLPGTPPQNCPNQKDSPDGILTSPSVYFHPHMDLVTQDLSEAPLQTAAPAYAPEPIADAVVLAAAGRLYLIGGTAGGGVSNRVYTYSLGADHWESGPALPQAVTSAMGAVVGDRLYVMGGAKDPGQPPTNAVQVLDTASGQWREGPPLPVAVSAAAAAAVGEKVYVISGWKSDGKSGKALSADLQILDTRSDTWERRENEVSMPAAGASAVTDGNEILVIGGRISGNKASNRTLIYNAEAGQWEAGPDLSGGASYAAAGRIDRRVYLAGGRDKADGPALFQAQELDLPQNTWRSGLPPLLPTYGSGGAVLDGALYVVGGWAQTGLDPAQGTLTQAVQIFRPATGWQACADLPVFGAASVLNAASLGMGLIGLGARQLSPGALAVLVGQNLPGPGSPPDAIEITVDGQKAAVVGFAALPPAIYFQIPPDLDPAKGRAELRLARPGSPVQAPPVEIPIAPAAPGIFLYNFGEVLEPAYLDFAPSLACNEDQSLNYASQSARPGEILSLWATGLGKNPDKDQLKATVGGKDAAVESIVPAPPLPPPFPPLLGVYLVQVRIPADAQKASNSPVVLQAGDLASNRASAAIFDEERSGNKVPCAYPLALGAAFPFLVPPPGK
jgi:uncharacterized protein (TIGR03437 family)